MFRPASLREFRSQSQQLGFLWYPTTIHWVWERDVWGVASATGVLELEFIIYKSVHLRAYQMSRTCGDCNLSFETEIGISANKSIDFLGSPHSYDMINEIGLCQIHQAKNAYLAYTPDLRSP
ncbi:hypothetical protein G7Y89_g12145 [Cudoniella acicularis]|uniref:Uncharacterized protein n=1 Tax=Cudoniella acicularis TaxID=354080 RepID=A0A8H4R9F7_9HELO|nr:hypothetical protein G7Y89_g12145 [Cudoniella acicularis]